MNLRSYSKFTIKKSLGRYLKRYSDAKHKFISLQQLIPSFMKERLSHQPADRRFLIISFALYDITEAIYAKAIEHIGYETHVLSGYNPFLRDIFNIFGINNLHFYDEFNAKFSFRKIRNEAKYYLQNTTREELLDLTKNGVKIGKYAISWLMRTTRSSSLDLGNSSIENDLTNQLANSILALNSAEAVLDKIKPDLLFVIDRGYTPVGQLFDASLNRGIPVIQRCSSHKSGHEILKRYYSQDKATTHHQSLSEESWEYIKKIPWDEHLWHELYNELKNTYASGDWFSEVGTQFNKRLYSKNESISKLELEPEKKVAIIFPHLFWDATFFWGKDLFKDYYDWFVNVLKVAAANNNLNWIIKIHPANIVKAKRDNYRGEHKELVSVYETLGQLPEHIKVIPPESDINTFSLFDIMDYCLTVRGTIGIEAAAMGINTLTAGTGRYDRLGFTWDFNSKDDYLECIRSLEKIPPMTDQAIELARRFAYGIFILRPIHLDLLDHGYNQDEKGSMRFRPLFKNRDEFEKSHFVQSLRSYVSSGKEDYLNVKIK